MQLVDLVAEVGLERTLGAKQQRPADVDAHRFPVLVLEQVVIAGADRVVVGQPGIDGKALQRPGGALDARADLLHAIHPLRSNGDLAAALDQLEGRHRHSRRLVELGRQQFIAGMRLALGHLDVPLLAVLVGVQAAVVGPHLHAGVEGPAFRVVGFGGQRLGQDHGRGRRGHHGVVLRVHLQLEIVVGLLADGGVDQVVVAVDELLDVVPRVGGRCQRVQVRLVLGFGRHLAVHQRGGVAHGGQLVEVFTEIVGRAAAGRGH